MKKRKANKKIRADEHAEIGTGSVYEQLGYKNHKEMETKSILVMEIGRAIKKKGLTQTKAAEILGISQPKLSSLLNGHFRGYSTERLMCFLNELGKDIDIVVRTKPSNRRARVNVYYSESRPSVSIAAKGRC